MRMQLDSQLARGDEEAAAFQKRPLCDPAARMAPSAQCAPMTAEMLAANTLQPVVEEPAGRGMRRR
jgi:hypothetical protein